MDYKTSLSFAQCFTKYYQNQIICIAGLVPIDPKSCLPISSYYTLYIIILRAGAGGPDTIAATGLAMLFSAGTFLYVATVHVLPEVTSGGGHSHGAASGDKTQQGSGGFSKSELAMLILGAVAPLFLSVGHHH